MSDRRIEVRPEDRRFFIVTAARSGSTLLAAILADAGAEFDMAAPAAWDRTGGGLEHPLLWRALSYFTAAETISAGRPGFGLARMRWVAYRSLAKRSLRTALARARFVKVYGAHKLVRPAFKVGYFPIVILSYRRFEDQALSLGLMYSHATWDFLHENYRAVYDSGLLLLHTFGGCAIAYEDLVDPDNASWAEPLACVTGLSASTLVEARKRRLDRPSPSIDGAWEASASGSLFACLNRTRNRAIPASAPALRAWAASAAAGAGEKTAGSADGEPVRPSHRLADAVARRALLWTVRQVSLFILIARDRRVSPIVKLVAALAVVSLLYPSDWFHHRIPLLGRVDEAATLALGVVLARLLFPPQIVAEHRRLLDRLSGAGAKPLSLLAKLW